MQIKQLRILATVLLGFAIGQAGLGSGFLNDEARALLIAHATNAFAVLVLTILAAVFGFNYRRSGGPGWVFFMPLAMVAWRASRSASASPGCAGSTCSGACSTCAWPPHSAPTRGGIAAQAARDPAASTR